MILAGDFYTINNFQKVDNAVKAELEFNVAHEIFAGHFPQQPVVPGVCMMQAVKELTEKALDTNLDLVSASDMKFLAVINPVLNNIVTAELKYTEDESGKINVVASLAKDSLTHFKFKGSFTQQPALSK
jgi:3-hydroxyacyl-[acyl-carrier-protein] dehydratase